MRREIGSGASGKNLSHSQPIFGRERAIHGVGGEQIFGLEQLLVVAGGGRAFARRPAGPTSGSDRSACSLPSAPACKILIHQRRGLGELVRPRIGLAQIERRQFLGQQQIVRLGFQRREIDVFRVEPLAHDLVALGQDADELIFRQSQLSLLQRLLGGFASRFCTTW